MKKSYKILLVIAVIFLIFLATGLKFSWSDYVDKFPAGYKGPKVGTDEKCENYGLYYPYLMSKGIVVKSTCPWPWY